MDYLKDLDRDELESELKKAWDEKDTAQGQLRDERSSWPARWIWEWRVPKKQRWLCFHSYFGFERRRDEFFIRTPLFGISWQGIHVPLPSHNKTAGKLEIGLLPNFPLNGGGYLYRHRITKVVKRLKPLAVQPLAASPNGFTCSVRG